MPLKEKKCFLRLSAMAKSSTLFSGSLMNLRSKAQSLQEQRIVVLTFQSGGGGAAGRLGGLAGERSEESKRSGLRLRNEAELLAAHLGLVHGVPDAVQARRQGDVDRVDGAVLVSGQVERSTSFERGFPIHYARAEGGWEPDPMIWDDQNVVINVRGKGLVVVSGCSHAGAVNVLRNAQRLTGEERIAGFVGGLHLTGGLFEPIIGETVAALAEMHVGVVMPAHCTGWQAVHALARTMPDAFVQPSIGTSVRI